MLTFRDAYDRDKNDNVLSVTSKSLHSLLNPFISPKWDAIKIA